MSGVWRSLVARLVWGREVASSNLAAPTIWRCGLDVFQCARSSTGQSIGLLSRWLQVRFLPGARMLVVVVVAQLVEPRIVIPVVVGSSPISHPVL